MNKYFNLHVLVNLVILLPLNLFSQKQTDTVYSNVLNNVFGEDAKLGEIPSSGFYGSSFDYAVYEFTNVLWANINNKKEQQRIENAKQQSLTKLNIIKTQYTSTTKYPETIIDGWHNVIATDNSTFCKDAKVYVKNNKIKNFVIDNYIPINFLSMGEIKNAKNVVTLKNFNGEQLNIMEVYFIYDLENQTLTTEPIVPGFVCFWTDLKNFEHIYIKMDGKPLNKFTSKFDAAPECFANGTVGRILKPGKYSFTAVGKGSIDWQGSFEIKSGKCLKYRLGKNGW